MKIIRQDTKWLRLVNTNSKFVIQFKSSLFSNKWRPISFGPFVPEPTKYKEFARANTAMELYETCLSLGKSQTKQGL